MNSHSFQNSFLSKEFTNSHRKAPLFSSIVEKKTCCFNKGFKSLLKLGFPESLGIATKYTKLSWGYLQIYPSPFNSCAVLNSHICCLILPALTRPPPTNMSKSYRLYWMYICAVIINKITLL